jgi:hypothetical protein
MKRKLFLPLLFLVFPLWAQPAPTAFVGLTLAELIEHFGAPRTVYAARGGELWQDDVIFQYADADFYIHRDRVWQVRVASAHGVSTGDPKQAAVLTLGDNAQDRGSYLLFPLTTNSWPLMLRVNFNNAGRVSAIYIYRPDY